MSVGDVRAAQAGDRGAFERLVRVHASSVAAIATAIVGHPEAGQDVVQDVFVEAWQALRRLRDPQRFGAWLRQIARHRARDARRRHARRRVTPVGEVADPAPPVSERLDVAAREAAVWEALEALDESHREVLVLFYREGSSVREVARGLGLREETVRKRLSRARMRLREGVAERLEPAVVASARSPRAVAGAVAVAIAGLVPRAAPAAGVGLWSIGTLVVAIVVVFGAATVGVDHVKASIPAASWAIVETEHPPAPSPQTSVPTHVVHAFLAAEDARFFEHGAVDTPAMMRAAWSSVSGGELQGASTITQQLARQSLREAMPERSLTRKAAEVMLAMELEQQLTKEQILHRYLEAVYFGAGATGLTQAAQVTFGKAVSSLTLAEAALLAGLVAAPTDLHPFADPHRARDRRGWVLERMRAHGWATDAEVRAADAARLPEAARGRVSSSEEAACTESGGCGP